MVIDLALFEMAAAMAKRCTPFAERRKFNARLVFLYRLFPV